jgi:hypothetical protein
MQFEVNEQERQLLEILREWAADEYRLEIERVDGAWEIGLFMGEKWARGFGNTFAEAWDDIAPSFA